MPDIDIDFADRDRALDGLPHVPATMVGRNGRTRHPTGVYFQNAPIHPMDGLCAFPHDAAGELGYFKIDLLNNSIYAGVRDEEHLRELLDREVSWDLLEEPEVVASLAHIRNHFDIVQAVRPQSIEDLAVVLALVRPGKRHLVGRSRAQIDAEIWAPAVDDAFTFKKAHAIAYAASIVVQLNLLIETLSADE